MMSLLRRRAVLFSASMLFLAFASAALAQRYRVMEGPGVPVRSAPPNFEDDAFTACKLMYTSNRREAGRRWLVHGLSVRSDQSHEAPNGTDERPRQSRLQSGTPAAVLHFFVRECERANVGPC